MFHMRPGTKIPHGMPSFKSKPSVEPPGLLRAISALSIISIVGVLCYSVVLAVSDITSSDIGIENSIYIAVLHFMLPFGVAYTVTTNNRLSRYIIAVYCVILYSATMAGKGLLGSLSVEFSVKAVLSTFVLILMGVWLFGSPKMRYYYALISDRPIPPELESRAVELAGRNWLGPRASAAVEWITDHLETLVLISVTLVAVFSCVSL